MSRLSRTRAALLVGWMFVACMVGLIWLRTFGRRDAITWASGNYYHEVATLPGQVRIVVAWRWPIAFVTMRWQTGKQVDVTFAYQPIYRGWRPGGAAMLAGTRLMLPPVAGGPPVAVGYRLWLIPLGPIVAVSVIVPSVVLAILARARRREVQRRAAGQCPACGYDCRATAGRCSECGWIDNAAALSS